MTRAKFDECYEAWKAHARKGNSYKLLKRMDSYVISLFKEDADESTEKNVVAIRKGDAGRCESQNGRAKGGAGLQHYDGQS